MNVLFVTEASAEVGGGHVMRCLTLADELARGGAKVAFLVNRDAPSFAPALSRSKFCFDTLDRLSDAPGVAGSRACDVVVLDSYAFDHSADARFRAPTRAVVVLDDLADRPRDCDLLIDTTVGRAAEDYRGLVPAGATLLCGADYTLLRPEFLALRDASIARRAASRGVERILVSLGLTDLGGITARVVPVVLDVDDAIQVDAVVGPTASSLPALRELARREPRLRLHIDPPDLAQLMAHADLAVGAGGTTSWERCCLGLPTVLLILAENQQYVASNLQRFGAALLACETFNGSIDNLRVKLGLLVSDGAIRRSIAAASASLVDGRGRLLIARAIRDTLSVRQSENASFQVRDATKADSFVVWMWRNDKQTRINFRDTQPVSWLTHSCWFQKRLGDPKGNILIGLQNDCPIGVVRFDERAANRFEVSINIAPDRRGTGLGLNLLRACCDIFFEKIPHATLVAQIREDNSASLHVFSKCGFSRIKDDSGFVICEHSPQA